MLTFGVEFEFLVQPLAATLQILKGMGWDENTKSDFGKGYASPRHISYVRAQDRNRQALRLLISMQIRAAGVAPTAQQDTPMGAITSENAGSIIRGYYSDWSVEDESSLDEEDGWWRVEVVSRILDTDSNWRGEIETVLNVLKAHYRIETPRSSGLHVHVGRGPTPAQNPDHRFTTEQIKKIAKAVYLFEAATASVVPQHRKESYWACPNHDSPLMDSKALYEAVPSITWGPLFEYVDSSRDRVELENRIHANVKYRSWSFKCCSGREFMGTMEFRRPPGTADSDSALLWAQFAVGFINAAITIDLSAWKPKKIRPTWKELAWFVQRGLDPLGPRYRGIFFDKGAKPVEIFHLESGSGSGSGSGE